MVSSYLNQEISYKEFLKTISTTFDAILYYRYFGHDGLFDELFVDSFHKYMLLYPQIYFQRTIHTDFPTFVQEDLSKNKQRYKSKIYNTPFKPETLFDLKDFERIFSNKIFTNQDGNFVMKSNNFHFVANFNNTLYIPDKETLEKLNVS